MFTRLSNFTYGNYQISNIGETVKNQDLALTIQIQKSEKEALRMILGDCLFTELMSQVELDGDGYWKLKTGSATKWDKLLNGTSYDASEIDYALGFGCGCCGDNCNTHYWDGLVKIVATVTDRAESRDIIETIMAPYIYRELALNSRTLNLGVGEGNGEAQTATMSNTKHKRVDAWNEFVQNVSVGAIGGCVSLQQYLREHAEDFPEASFNCFDIMTYW